MHLQSFFQQHVDYHSQFSEIIELIKSGVFQHRVKNNECKIDSTVDQHLQTVNNLWNKLSYPKLFPAFTIQVYRAFYDFEFSKEIHHPLPFSTTLSLSFAQDWLFGRHKKAILVIYTSSPCFFISDEQDKNEFEVLFPAGNVIVDKFLKTENDIDYYECLFNF